MPKKAPIPTLFTQRLTLRGHTFRDLDACAAMWGDPVVNRFIGGRPLTREETWARLLRYAGLWALLGYGYWIVQETATQRFAGEVGLADFKRELEPALGNTPEVGWVLTPSAFGRGIATEAVCAVLAWSDAHLEAKRTACLIAPDNTASVRVAEKCGFREVRPATYKGVETLVFQRERIAPKV